MNYLLVHVNSSAIILSIVATSMFYQLESFSSCFARLETKLNVRFHGVVLIKLCTGATLPYVLVSFA
jgi:hypothetical protein